MRVWGRGPKPGPLLFALSVLRPDHRASCCSHRREGAISVTTIGVISKRTALTPADLVAPPLAGPETRPPPPARRQTSSRRATPHTRCDLTGARARPPQSGGLAVPPGA